MVSVSLRAAAQADFMPKESLDEYGYIRTNKHMQVEGVPGNVFAIGDVVYADYVSSRGRRTGRAGERSGQALIGRCAEQFADERFSGSSN